MAHNISTQWMGKMQFNTLVNGHTIVMDAPERAGGEDNGSIPKPLLLSALSGCTGMDVIALLRKAQKPVTDLSIDITANTSKSIPVIYTDAHILYNFYGPPAHKDAAIQAVITSQEKLCGVSHMLKKIMPVTWEIYYNNEKTPAGKLIN